MENSKLIKFIIQLPPKERIRFKDYLLSPYFNKQENLIKLWNFLHNKIKKSPISIDKKKLFKSIFPNKEYHEQILKNLLSDLMNQLISFMGIQQYMSQPVRKHIDSLEYALDNRMFEFIDFNKKRALKLLEKDKAIQVEKELYLSQLSTILCIKDLRTQDKSFFLNAKQELLHLENYQLAKQLKTHCIMLSDSEEFNNTELLEVREKLKNQVTEKWEIYKHHPLISIYYKILNLFYSEDSHNAYINLKEELNIVKAKLAFAELEQIYKLLERFCISRINIGIVENQFELFDLYQEMLDFPTFQLTEAKYKNIAIIGCRIGKLDWVNNFLKNRKKDLPASNRENAYFFNLALIEVYRNNYNKSLEFLNQVEVTDASYYTSVKYALIKIYYELEEYDAISYILESFRIWMLRNKKRFRNKKTISTFNFLKFVEKLIKLKTSSLSKKDRSMKVTTLQEKISTTDLLVNKPWLLNKLAHF